MVYLRCNINKVLICLMIKNITMLTSLELQKIYLIFEIWSAISSLKKFFYATP